MICTRWSLGARPHRPLRTYYLYLITLCSYYKNPVKVGITYIPSADLYYRLVELYSLSTVNSFLNIKNHIMFFNKLIINFHIYTIIHITRKYVMNETNTHNNNIIYNIYTDSKMPREVKSLVQKYMGQLSTFLLLLHFANYRGIFNFWWKLYFQ